MTPSFSYSAFNIGVVTISVRIAASFFLSTSSSFLFLIYKRFVCFCNFQLEIQPHSHQTIYGLHLGKEYEVHIRCRMQVFIKFGEFSESIFIQVTEIPSTGNACVRMMQCIFGELQTVFFSFEHLTQYD